MVGKQGSMEVAERWKKKERAIQPEKVCEDPYIVSILIALAQEQAARERLARGDDRSDSSAHVVHAIGLPGIRAKEVYFYRASIPSAFLRKLEWPSEASEGGWVMVRYRRISLIKPQRAAARLWRLLSKNFAA